MQYSGAVVFFLFWLATGVTSQNKKQPPHLPQFKKCGN
jgi:hypothetical protein